MKSFNHLAVYVVLFSFCTSAYCSAISWGDIQETTQTQYSHSAKQHIKKSGKGMINFYIDEQNQLSYKIGVINPSYKNVILNNKVGIIARAVISFDVSFFNENGKDYFFLVASIHVADDDKDTDLHTNAAFIGTIDYKNCYLRINKEFTLPLEYSIINSVSVSPDNKTFLISEINKEKNEYHLMALKNIDNEEMNIISDKVIQGIDDGMTITNLPQAKSNNTQNPKFIQYYSKLGDIYYRICKVSEENTAINWIGKPHKVNIPTSTKKSNLAFIVKSSEDNGNHMIVLTDEGFLTIGKFNNKKNFFTWLPYRQTGFDEYFNAIDLILSKNGKQAILFAATKGDTFYKTVRSDNGYINISETNVFGDQTKSQDVHIIATPDFKTILVTLQNLNIGVKEDNNLEYCVGSFLSKNLIDFMRTCPLIKFLPTDTTVLFLAQSSIPFKASKNVNDLLDNFVAIGANGKKATLFNSDLNLLRNETIHRMWVGCKRLEQIEIPNIDAQTALNIINRTFKIDYPVSQFSIIKNLNSNHIEYIYALLVGKTTSGANVYEQYIYDTRTKTASVGIPCKGWFNLDDYISYRKI